MKIDMSSKLFYLNVFLIICFCMILAFYYDEFFTGIFTIVFCLTFLIVLDNVKTKEILALTEIEITYRRKLLLLITWIYSFLFLAICINDKLLLIVSILFFILGIIIVIYYQQKIKKRRRIVTNSGIIKTEKRLEKIRCWFRSRIYNHMHCFHSFNMWSWYFILCYCGISYLWFFRRCNSFIYRPINKRY